MEESALERCILIIPAMEPRKDFAGFIEFNDAESFRIRDVLSKDRRAAFVIFGFFQHLAEVVAMEYIIS